MNITWYGQSYFRLGFKEEKRKKEKVSLAIDPFGKEVGLNPPSSDADIALITHEHFDHNNRALLKEDCFVIDSPGEYELKGVFIQGIVSYHDQEKGEERGGNTIYTMEAEGMRVCHMGDFGQKELTSRQLEEMGNVDILMLPVGGVYTVDAQEAARIVSQVEPRVVIPMHYKIPGLKVELEDVEVFLKAIGKKEAETREKLVLNKKDFSSLEMQVVPLLPKAKSL